MIQNQFQTQAGQALVPLLIFVMMGIVVTTFTVILVINNSFSASIYQQGTKALSVAESGVENAMMRLLRDPDYSGETLNVGGGQAIVTVVGTSSVTITSQGSFNQHQRTIVVEATQTTGIYTITSWQEIP